MTRHIRFVSFDRRYLDLSWDWLRDPEIKKLTMAGDFTREQQVAFFETLPCRDDYKIWGVESVEGEPVGAAGIKNISGQEGEFWCYIGNKAWWGRGIGGEILLLCEEKAAELGLESLTMIAASDNSRSISAFEKMGFTPDAESSTATLSRLSKVTGRLRIERYRPELVGVWNAVVAAARNGLFQFDRGYMDYHADRFEDCSAVAWLNDKPVAVMPASIDRKSGAITSHAGLTFGGLIVGRGLRGTSALAMLDATLDAMREWGGKTLSVRMLPAVFETFPSAEPGYGLWRRGFALVRRDLSSVLPLDAPPEFNSSKKQALAKARKAGLSVAGGSLAQFHALLVEVLGWRHGVEPVHTLAELEMLMAAFPDNILLRTVEHEGTTIAGALVYCYPTAWHTQYLASSPEGRSLGALDLVIASLIDDATAAGAKWFSFGTSTTDAGRSLNSGLLWQKESFGARSVTHDVLEGTL